VAAQILDRVLTCWRIGDPQGEFPIFDATGSKLFPGRWNSAASPVIYASEHYSTAMLEKLAHGSGHLPPNQHAIEITIPNGVSYELVEEWQVPGWDAPSPAAAQAHGEAWWKARRSLLLVVPSLVARMERNFLIHPEHPEFARVTHGLHRPVWWDGRLFGR